MTRFSEEAERAGWRKAEREAEIGRRVAAYDADHEGVTVESDPDKPRGEVLRPERAQALFASTKFTDEDWKQVFDADPDPMWKLIGDMVRFDALEDTPRGNRKSGAARLDPKVANLDNVRRILSPQYSTEPFPVAFEEIRRGRSLRAIAQRAGLAHYSLSRYLSGDRGLTMEVLEQIAVAGKVSPHFFREYRSMWLAQRLTEFLSSRPNESIAAVRRMTIQAD